MVYRWAEIIRNALLPPVCLLCGAPGDGSRDLCAGCAAELPRNRHACARCAEPLPASAAGAVCGRCQRRPPHFDAALAPLRYAYPVDALVLQLKFGHRIAVARLLGELLADALDGRSGPLPELLIPIPLHPRRLRERGFNQAAEIARTLARRTGLALAEHTMRRARHTRAQSELPFAERAANVARAFVLHEQVRARHVALVDDVITTGHTADAAARTLRLQAGVERIEVWAPARTPPPDG